MKHLNNITPIIDLTNSREYYGMYNSRDFYKGTSFKMAGEWAPNTHYFNDEYIIDFVAYQGALLSCIRSHISTVSGGDVPQLIYKDDKIIGIAPNAYWVFVMSGTEGPEGKVWIPKVSEDGTISWIKDRDLINFIPSQNIKGQKGDKGDPGNDGAPGPEQEFKLDFSKDLGMSVLYSRPKGSTKWNYLGPVGGTPGKSPKLIREKGDPNTYKDDRILWGYDGVPVSKWTTLCYLEDLRGDTKIAYGCSSDFEGGAPPTDQIWFDPCDTVVDQYSLNDLLYQAYLSAGGTLKQKPFEQAFANLSNTSGFSVRFAASYDTLPYPTKDLLGSIYMVPQSGSKNNWYEEYIVIHAPSAPEDEYTWEKIGIEKISSNLDDYATKQDLSDLKSELEDQIKELVSSYWNEVK